MSDNKNSNNDKDYTPLLSDDDGNAKPIRRKDPRSKVQREIEEQQRRQREKTELLKLKQGISEEEEQPEPEIRSYEKPKGFKAVENFIYHNKWYLGIALFAVFVVTVLTVQMLTREKQDLYVLVIANNSSSGLYAKADEIEVALEKYCPDFDGNGYVHVAVNYIDLMNRGVMTQYADAQQSKFSAELFTGDSQLYVSDRGIIGLINDFAARHDPSAPTEEATAETEEALLIEFFTDMTEQYPDSVFYQGCGLQLNTTGFAELARWSGCPDSVGLYLRDEFENMTGNSKNAKEQRERAKIVYDNIIKGNVVNPDWEGR